MGHPHKRLSDRSVRAKRPGLYADGGSLYLQVAPGGSRSWILRTLVHGKRREIGMGGYPTVSLNEARDLAHKYRKIARAGGDPVAERDKDKKEAPAFEAAARAVHEAYAEGWKNPKHAAQWISTLEEYVFPVFGQRRVDLIDSADLLKALSPIWLAKPETARRVRQRIGAVLNWAKAAGHRSAENPTVSIAKGLPKQPKVRAHHAALPYADVPAFIGEMRALEATESAKLAFEFLVLTAARTGEVRFAEWPEIDFKAAVWTVPGSRMKAGREHRVPLSPRAVEILERAKELTEGRGLIFPSRGARKPLSENAFLAMLARMGRDITAHGFRSSFRDWSAEKTNFPREVCEAALAHTVRDATEAAYRRTDLFERRRELMNTWAAFVTSAKGKVRTLRSAA